VDPVNGGQQIEIRATGEVVRARHAARAAMAGHSPESVTAAELVTSELVTNALLHGGGVADVTVSPIGDGIRVEVGDRNRRGPLMVIDSSDAMTGRGLHLVGRLATRWGVFATEVGKVVWAEITDVSSQPPAPDLQLLDRWPEAPEESGSGRVRVVLGEVPTSLLVAAKRHVDNLVREFTLAATGDRSGTTAPVPPHLAELIESVVHGFEHARLVMKRQATQAARAGATHAHLELELPPEVADGAESYLAALDEIDGYSRANRLLTLETPPQHRLFRRWYITELVTQLRAAQQGREPPRVVPFEERLLREVDAAELARGKAERAARLYTVAMALASSVSAEDVATAVLREGVAALGASGGGVVLNTGSDRLLVPGTLGYAEPVVEKLRHEQIDANLPAAHAMRTAEGVWLETVEERDARFPELVGLEPDTVAMCAVPLCDGDDVLGALRFSFTERRLFDDDEQQFVRALAAEAAEALVRARLVEERTLVAEQLQQSLLPAELPVVPGVELGAAYSTGGEGVGGDFYDIFSLGDSTWGVVVGDVRGRGPQAAALTTLARYTIRTAARLGLSPAGVLDVLNDALLEEGDGEQFCTVVYGVLDVRSDGARLIHVNGGHPPIAVVREEGVEFPKPAGRLAGIAPGALFEEHCLDLVAGDTLVLYTDGISEARTSREQFGDRRLADVLATLGPLPAPQAAQRVCDEARAFGAGGSDDAAVFVIHLESR
jgi:serine phosphatase RsbU (regulator of sigma subunit)